VLASADAREDASQKAVRRTALVATWTPGR
jgi:hypothetical protein